MSVDTLSQIRELLVLNKIDAFIVGSGDAHQSEYVMESDKRRAFASNFTGSAGTALITLDKALLWTDGRYFLQASQELSTSWTLMKSGEPGVPELDIWLTEHLKEGSIIGIDAFLVSLQQATVLGKLLKDKKLTLQAVERNPVDIVWERSGSKPSISKNPIIVHSLALAGKSYEDKIEDVKAHLEKNSAGALLVSALDSIAWLLNIRGSDIDFNPVTVSYVVVTLKKTFFFVDEGKVTPAVREHLKPDIVEILPYEAIEEFLKNLSKDAIKVLIDPSQVNWRLSLALGESGVSSTSPITLAKSIKNAAELEGIRQAHIRDGVALTAFLHWLETHVRTGGSIDEFGVTEKIEEFRKKMPLHVCPSFETIAGYGANGAIIHYKPKDIGSKNLDRDSLFLLDSGAQYLDGTTDVTRTIHFGEVTDRMKNCYTLVLKGHISLARAVFPEGTTGSRLDSFARMPLWNYGLDFNHGTGHGVGAFLNVHEGPQAISFRPRPNEQGFISGMTISNEPGYYEDEGFGVRIENICITVDAETQNNFLGRKFCRFENATLVPIKTSLINLDLLEDGDIKYLNEYHQLVREKLTSLMNEYFPEAVEYLIQETAPITK